VDPSLSARSIVGEWLSLVEHLVRDQGVGGSNPLSPTNLSLALSIYGYDGHGNVRFTTSELSRLNKSNNEPGAERNSCNINHLLPTGFNRTLRSKDALGDIFASRNTTIGKAMKRIFNINFPCPAAGMALSFKRSGAWAEKDGAF
jgi:hypothetical protein